MILILTFNNNIKEMIFVLETYFTLFQKMILLVMNLLGKAKRHEQKASNWRRPKILSNNFDIIERRAM